ncbi:MAG: YggT family protein [SAR202 cluster bacterium]|nr:YggT family protein [SAR202 cluster bacterium]
MNFFANFLNILTWVLIIAIFARSLLSWVVRDPANPFMGFLISITEPILAPLRRILPTFGMIDLSPTVALVILFIIQQFVVRALRG